MSELKPIASLLLDERNPRFAEEVDSQEAAITELLLAPRSKLANLAKDIAEEGILNPTELPIVVEEDGDLVVVEGNRRIAALKLLRNPELARTASEQRSEDLVKRFKEIQQIGLGPDLVEVSLFESRDVARHWIELRHTGENDGVGVIGWESWQANNYRRRRGSQVDRATTFCEAVETEFADDTELLEKVTQVRRTRLSTLGRLVADPDVRQEFGFDLVEGEIFFNYTTDELRAGIMQILTDMSATGEDRVTVTDIKKKPHRNAYVRERSNVLPDRSRKLAKTRRPGEAPEEVAAPAGDSSGSAQTEWGAGSSASGSSSSGSSSGAPGDTNQSSGSNTPGGSPPSSTGTKGRTPPPENVIFKSLKLPNVGRPVRDLLQQAQKINIEDAPQVTGILVRILVELVVTDGINKGVVRGNESDKLKQKIGNALLALDSNCADPTKRQKHLELAWTRSQDGDSLAVQSLNAFVHNPHGMATPREVRSLSLAFRPLIEGVDHLIRNKP